MKKKNFLYTGTLALGMFMSGCSDSFLDMNNYGAYVWGTERNVY